MTDDYRDMSDTSPDFQRINLRCQKCSYQLIGVHRDGQCPECRHSVALSRRAWIAEEAVAGVATQSLTGVCVLILARNFCLFIATFRPNWGGGFFLLLAIVLELVASLGLRGAMSVAQTPGLLKNHPILEIAHWLWNLIIAWPFIIGLIVIGSLIKRTGLFIIVIACGYFLTRSILWSTLFYGLRHRAKARGHFASLTLLSLAAGASLLFVIAMATTIALSLTGKIGIYSFEKLILVTFIAGTTLTATLTGAGAWLISKPAWEEKLEN